MVSTDRPSWAYAFGVFRQRNSEIFLKDSWQTRNSYRCSLSISFFLRVSLFYVPTAPAEGHWPLARRRRWGKPNRARRRPLRRLRRLDFPVNKSSRSAGRPRHFCHRCRRSRLSTTSSSSSSSPPRAASLFIPSRRQSRTEKRHPGGCQRILPLRAFPTSGSWEKRELYTHTSSFHPPVLLVRRFSSQKLVDT